MSVLAHRGGQTNNAPYQQVQVALHASAGEASPSGADGNENLAREVQELKATVSKMEKTLANLKSVVVGTALAVMYLLVKTIIDFVSS